MLLSKREWHPGATTGGTVTGGQTHLRAAGDHQEDHRLAIRGRLPPGIGFVVVVRSSMVKERTMCKRRLLARVLVALIMLVLIMVEATGSSGAALGGSGALSPSTACCCWAQEMTDDTACGGDRAFATSATPTVPPAVVTGYADRITASSAQVSGTLTSLGSASSVTVSVIWGTAQGGPYTEETSGVVQTATVAFHFELSGLASGATFYYQAKAEGDGTAYGEELSFTTGSPGGGAPVVEGLAADSGRRGETLTVTITGSNLKEATAVSFGAGITIKEFRAVSDTEMTVRLIIGSEAELGDRDFTVTTPMGTATSPGGFTVNKAASWAHLWVYLAVALGGVVGLGMVATLAIRLRRRPEG